MEKKSLVIKILALMISVPILLYIALPITMYASSMQDNARKIVLKTVEDIENNIEETKYPGYKEKLLTLKKSNPSWNFTLYYTGIDWNTVIKNETIGLHGRSLVQGKAGEWLCDSCGTKVYDKGGWMCASPKAVAYLMDTRNYLNESNLFQFEELSYNPDSYTIEGIEKVLKGTFMYQKSVKEYYQADFDEITFSQAIMQAANTSGVSPYYLAARIRQEIGINGSDSIYGTYRDYEGYYNFYNIGANSGTDPIKNGLIYASNNTMGKYLLPWNDPVKAIKGGAIWIATNYIAVGQDTLYFQKFDVVNNGTAFYTHQYMQNIFAAQKEGYTTYLTYKGLQLLDNNYHFIIPVYENMPKVVSAEPKDELNEKMIINASSVILRKNPGTSSARLTTLAKNTEVTRIQKNVQNVNGYNWDKVKLANGTIGYVASNYLSNKPVTVQSTTSSTATNTIGKPATSTATTNTVATNIAPTLEEKVKTKASSVIVRNSPGTSSKKITTLAKGTQLTRLQKNVKRVNGYDWDQVKLANGTIGYMANKYLSSVSGTSSSNTTSNIQTAKTIQSVNVRKSATTSSKKVTTLKKNTKVTVLQKKVAYKNGYYWDKVKLSNGKTGYIASKFLK